MTTEQSNRPPLSIGLTRPEGANDALASALSTLMPDAILIDWPLLDFSPTSNPEQARAALAQIAADDWAIFVSPRAVHFAHNLHDLTTLPKVHWASVGETTKASIEALFTEPPRVHHPATTQDSEGLLANLPIETMRGHTVWLIRGETGREKLANTLRDQGIMVRPVAVYQRHCAPSPAQVPLPTIWVITSPESLKCLRELADQVETPEEHKRLLHCNLVVINERTEAHARRLGFTGLIVRSESPDNKALAFACAISSRNSE